jgi:hypothetical protein
LIHDILKKKIIFLTSLIHDILKKKIIFLNSLRHGIIIFLNSLRHGILKKKNISKFFETWHIKKKNISKFFETWHINKFKHIYKQNLIPDIFLQYHHHL